LGIGMMSAYALQIAVRAFLVLEAMLSPVCLARAAPGGGHRIRGFVAHRLHAHDVLIARRDQVEADASQSSR
jgi:hypothetical protein